MTVNQIAVVGAGVMGRGIAYVSALAGFRTILVDVSEQQLEDAFNALKQLTEKGVQRGKLTDEQASKVLSHIHMEKHLEAAMADTDLLIEAVPEKHSLKQYVFETADRHAPAHTILASNTSTMSPTELGSYTNRPQQVVAMHFFNPVHQMKLVEIVRGLETSDETVAVIREISGKMGKESVEVNEFPGFVTSRISALVGNEAFHMLQEGVASAADIDKAVRLGLNFPMGPFELGDLVGLDARLNNLNYLHEKLGEKFRPAPLLEQYVKAGRLGRKSGRGVYDYMNKGEGINT